MPQRREPMPLETGQRRHAKVEEPVALRSPPQHQLDQQEVHDPVRGVAYMTHQIDRAFVEFPRRPQVCECNDAAAGLSDRARTSAQVRAIKEPEREALLSDS